MTKYTIGNGESTIINDLDIKTKIIDYLFNSVNLSKYRFNMLESIDQLKFLKSNVHYVSPNFSGYNYFLIFTRINNLSYCVLIDKKKFSYHKDKLNMKMIKILKIKILASSSIFNGSILDCKLIRSKQDYYLLIKDCYKLMGNDLTKMELVEKMNYLNNIISNTLEENKYFEIKINKLFDYKDLDKLINTIIPKSKFTNQGLIFFPKYSGISIIYSNNKKNKNKVEIRSNENISNASYTLITDIDKILKNRVYSYETDGKKDKLQLEKTDISDVYQVYNKDNERLGIAHIPNLKISLYCKGIFEEKNKEYFNCIYNNDFKKWIPLNKI